MEQSKPGEEGLDACLPSVVTLALESFWFSDRLRWIEAGLPSTAPHRGTNKHLAEDGGNNRGSSREGDLTNGSEACNFTFQRKHLALLSNNLRDKIICSTEMVDFDLRVRF